MTNSVLPIVGIPPLKLSTVEILHRFFDAHEAADNTQMFNEWNALIQAFHFEPDLYVSCFYYWIYSNTLVNGEQLAPQGFEFSCGIKFVCYFSKAYQKGIRCIRLTRAKITIADPAELYHKLGITQSPLDVK